MSDFPETSHSLIERVHDSANGAAWAEFPGIYQPVVYRMARRRGLQDADSPTKWSYRGVKAMLEYHLRDKGPAYALSLHQNGIVQKAKRLQE